MVDKSPEQREKELLTSVETMANIGSFWYEPASGDLYWSPQLREIHGVARDEPITYEQAMAFHLPEYRENIEHWSSKAFKITIAGQLKVVLKTEVEEFTGLLLRVLPER